MRGAGDIATGVIQKLVHAGFAVVALEVERPMAIRWRAALSPAVEHGRWAVEDLVGVRVETPLVELVETPLVELVETTSRRVVSAGSTSAGSTSVVPVLVDPDARCLAELCPWAVVDAILAKRNVGTHRGMAPVTVGLGPGFTAGDDVDYVVETMRGHELGRVISSGQARPNTGVPGLIAGKASERVIHAPVAGRVSVVSGIGTLVEAGQTLCRIAGPTGETDVAASIGGVVRGMIPDGYDVPAGLKIADVDPRADMVNACDTISDKSRAVGGAALDAVLQGLCRAGLYGPR